MDGATIDSRLSEIQAEMTQLKNEEVEFYEKQMHPYDIARKLNPAAANELLAGLDRRMLELKAEKESLEKMRKKERAGRRKEAQERWKADKASRDREKKAEKARTDEQNAAKKAKK